LRSLLAPSLVMIESKLKKLFSKFDFRIEGHFRVLGT
jgi:hypothetical protein